MEIKNITDGNLKSSVPDTPKPNKNTTNSGLINKSISDRLEISKEAHQLQEETLVQTDLEEIKEKVENGYYDDPAIIEKVAELILKEIAG